MLKQTYKAKVTIRSKGKYCFHVPKHLVEEGTLKLNQEYDLTIKEHPKEDAI